MRVEIGQLRVWVRPDHPRDQGKPFLITGPGPEPGPGEPVVEDTWSFVIDGKREWHFDDVISRDSEVVSEAG